MNSISVFEFAEPAYLWLLSIVPLIIVVYALLLLWRRRKLSRFGHKTTLKELMPDYSVARGWVRITLFALAIGFIVVAMARPQTGSKLRSIETKGREIVLAVDVSNSMMAEDTEPSRMARTRYAIQQLLRQMKSDHIGIVAFADDVEVVLPITSDYKMAEAKVRSLSPALIANQGTDIGEALEVALLSFGRATQESANSRVIILITDGEAHDAKAVEVAARAKEEGVVICTIGIGTPEGVILEIDGKPVEDEEGKMVLTNLNEAILQEVTETSQGIYRRAYNGDFGLNKIIERLDEIEESSLTTSRYEEYDEKYQWFLGVALLLLTAESLILSRRNPLLRNVKLFDREEDNTMEHKKTNKR